VQPRRKKAAINAVRAELEGTAIHSIRSELVETIKYRVEEVLSRADQKKQGLRKEMTEKTDETQVDVQAARTYVYTRTKSLLERITDARENPHEVLGFMIQGEAQITKILIDTTRGGLEAKIAEVEVRA
jgi:ElaB/YqjD/DUF883 family membrane-anchored ribosome-binding protein